VVFGEYLRRPFQKHRLDTIPPNQTLILPTPMLLLLYEVVVVPDGSDPRYPLIAPRISSLPPSSTPGYKADLPSDPAVSWPCALHRYFHRRPPFLLPVSLCCCCPPCGYFSCPYGSHCYHCQHWCWPVPRYTRWEKQQEQFMWQSVL